MKSGMPHASLIAAGAVVLLANAFALIHAAMNRSGEPEAEIALSERELTYYADPDDSAGVLTLRWVNAGAPRYSPALTPEEFEASNWLNRAKLVELGFDCRVDPTHRDAYAFYTRQGARNAYVALEYDGPAWQSWIELEERLQKAEAALTGQKPPAGDYQRTQGPRLVAIDAATAPAPLRARHPDRSRVLILPGLIRISVGAIYRPQQPAILTGYVQEIPATIHVPRPYSDRFRSDPRPLRYLVRLSYGKSFEPWIVDFTPQ